MTHDRIKTHRQLKHEKVSTQVEFRPNFLAEFLLCEDIVEKENFQPQRLQKLINIINENKERKIQKTPRKKKNPQQ